MSERQIKIGLLVIMLTVIGTSLSLGYSIGKHRADRWWNASVRSDKEFLYIYNVSFPGNVTLRAKQANLIGNYFEKGVTFSDGTQVSSADNEFVAIDPRNEPMATWCSDAIKQQRSIQ